MATDDVIETLQSVNGVGETTAEKLVATLSEHNRFAITDETAQTNTEPDPDLEETVETAIGVLNDDDRARAHRISMAQSILVDGIDA